MMNGRYTMFWRKRRNIIFSVLLFARSGKTVASKKLLVVTRDEISGDVGTCMYV